MSRSLLTSRMMSCCPIARCGLHVRSLGLGVRIARVDQHRDHCHIGHQLAQQFQSLRPSTPVKKFTPVTLPPGRLRLSTRPSLTGSPPTEKTIGTVVVAAFAASAEAGFPTITATGRRPVRPPAPAADHIVLPLMIFDRNVPALDEASFPQALAKRGHEVRRHQRSTAAEEADHRHRRLLRARGERPRYRRAAKRRDKLASLHGSVP